jgi:hypothetical protein
MKLRICFFILVSLIVALPAEASTISLTPASPPISGSTFDVLVQVTNLFSGRAPDDTLLAYGFDVNIGNSSIFNFLGETPGPLFDDLPIFGGIPMVAGIATSPLGIGPSDFTDPLTLATLHFTALKSGTTSISVTWDSSDPNQGLVYFDLPYGPISGSVSITAVPEPSTLFLFAPAAVLLFLCHRRRIGIPQRPRA